eukprot:5928308-Pyramimonas_sp.AAC.3
MWVGGGCVLVLPHPNQRAAVDMLNLTLPPPFSTPFVHPPLLPQHLTQHQLASSRPRSSLLVGYNILDWVSAIKDSNPAQANVTAEDLAQAMAAPGVPVPETVVEVESSSATADEAPSTIPAENAEKQEEQVPEAPMSATDMMRMEVEQRHKLLDQEDKFLRERERRLKLVEEAMLLKASQLDNMLEDALLAINTDWEVSVHVSVHNCPRPPPFA